MHKIRDMEHELDSNRMIQKAADLQAQRDQMLREQSRQIGAHKDQFKDLEVMLGRKLEEEKVLKQRIRELEVLAMLKQRIVVCFWCELFSDFACRIVS